MERQGIHELSAAYALHALDPEEERAFEQHLARCQDCRGEVTSFQEASALLAYDVQAAPPPPPLRERILAQARADKAVVVPLSGRSRWLLPATAGLAAAAAVAALALGIWAASLSSTLADERAAKAGADVVQLAGAQGSLIVTEEGEGALVVDDLERAPVGKTYEAWVIEEERPRPAGTFPGGGERTAFVLTRPVPPGAVVAVTLEAAGGVEQPTQEPLFTATNA